MNTGQNRRTFLQMAAGGSALLGLGDLAFISRLPRVSAQEAQLDSDRVRFDDDIEPLVRLLEETPREQVIEAFAERIGRGTSYQQVLAALLLAGVRNVQPRPAVGFKFHAVLVVNSAHIASLASPDTDRWLPIFWALDYFKTAQAADEREGDWTMRPVDEGSVPPAHRARETFVQAMERWDEAAADAAVASLARSAGANELFEIFARFGARDFRNIGHKAIFVANAFRTLHCIGWRYAEPVLRSLAYALLTHTGEPNPADNDLAPDRAWRLNQELVKEIRPDWQHAGTDQQATEELLNLLRTGSSEEVCREVVQLLNRGVSPQSIQDAFQVSSVELLMRQPAIVALHAVTTTNAMQYAFRTAGNDETRRLLLLQNAAFLPLFLQGMRDRGSVSDMRISEIGGADAIGDPAESLNTIFDKVRSEPADAASRLLAYLEAGGDARQFVQAARRLIFLKGTDSHDYKFSSAVLEDYYGVSPEWRNRFLAASVFHLRGSEDADNSLVQRTRAALQV